MENIREERVVEPLSPTSPPINCYKCGEPATHQALGENGKKTPTCGKKSCVGPLLFNQEKH